MSFPAAVEPIAIIGMSGRLLGHRNLDASWRAITSNDIAPSLPAPEDDPNDLSWFDADFFGISAREAPLVAPPHRLLLECAWEALESASYNPDCYKGRIGVYASVDSDDHYFRRHLLPHSQSFRPFDESTIKTLTSPELAPLWVSNTLNLHGPCFCLGSGECSSIASVHLACQSLRDRECDMAIAGGVGILKQPRVEADRDAGHHWRAGFVLLKTLANAVANRDSIQAVIRGSGAGRSGMEKTDLTSSSFGGVAQAVAESQQRAGIQPDTQSYIEITNTRSDIGAVAIESMLSEVSGCSTSRNQSCALASLPAPSEDMGSIKGIAGLINVALALKHRIIPCVDASTPRRAVVMAIGPAGTSAHAVVEEAPEAAESRKSRLSQVLSFSAKSAQALEKMAASLKNHLIHHSDVNLADVAYSLHAGRKTFGYRKSIMCRTASEAVAYLGNEDPAKCSSGFSGSANRPVVFMFPGAGAHYAQMGRHLYESEIFFRDEFNRCCEIVRSQEGIDLRSAVYPDNPQVSLDQPVAILAGLFAVEYSLAVLWMRLGVQPESMIGHSLGEYVAACLSGVFTLEDALKLVVFRGRLFETLPAGAMLSISLGESEVLPLLTADLSLAGINAPTHCVVSGSVATVKELQEKLSSRNVDTRLLHVGRAGHSASVTPIMDEFMKFVGTLTLMRPRIPYMSNYTGTWIRDAEAVDPQYWAAHLRHTVRFAAGLDQLLLGTDRIFLEVGPGRTLSGLARQYPQSGQRVVLSSMRHIKDGQSDVEVLLQTVGKLWTAGVHIDSSALYFNEDRRRLALPTYPFERRRHWVDAASLPEEAARAAQNLSHQCLEPRNEIEKGIARIWQDVLGAQIVSVDRGFGESGGTESLRRQMLDRLTQEFGVVAEERCSAESTIAEMADLVAERALEEIPDEELSQALADLDLPPL